MEHKFGGLWTIKKLDILKKYLEAYTTALKNQPFELIYIDAFAGMGKVACKLSDEEIKEINGSVKLALEVKPLFNDYYFIEKNKLFSNKLKDLVRKEYYSIQNRIHIKNEECNTYLNRFCKEYNWNNKRAVLFLDPYGMGAEWSTIKSIAETRVMDLWYLFSLSAVNRLLQNRGEIPEGNKKRLRIIFGDNNWEDEFYMQDPQISFFDNDRLVKREKIIKQISNYIIKRLNTIFPAVAENPKILYNSKNSPMFLFCFAISNPSKAAQKRALDIAQYILSK